MVIPPAKGDQLFIQLHAIINQDQPDMRLEGTKEALDPTILPGAMFLGGLVTDAQQPQAEPEQSTGEDRFIIGADNLWLAKLLDHLPQAAEQRDGRLVGQTLQGNCQAGMMFANTEDSVLMLVTISHLRHVDAPVFSFRCLIGGAAFDLALQYADLVLVFLDSLRHKTLANVFALVGKEAIEGQRQSPATGFG